jgi:NADH:ubiquinone oxidoreductase subunit D
MEEIREIMLSTDEIKTDDYLVNMGPQHPSTQGVLRLLVKLEGEKVMNVQPHIG